VESELWAGSLRPVLPVGLDPMDDVRATLERSAREVFVNACLDPVVAQLEASVVRGIPKDESGFPDLRAYLLTYDHYLYLRRACEEGLPAKENPEVEAPHLRAIFEILRSRRATAAARAEDSHLRHVIRWYGARAGPAVLDERRLAALEKNFAEHATAYIDELRRWMDDHLQRVLKHRDALDAAVEALREECAKRQVQIRSHPSPDHVRVIAEAIRAAGSRYEVAVRQARSLAEVAGVMEPKDLLALLLELRTRLEGYPVLHMHIDRLTGSFDALAGLYAADKTERARLGIVEFLSEVGEPSAPLDGTEWSPSAETLLSRQEAIEAELSGVAASCWVRLRPYVEVLKAPGERLEESVEASGQPEPRLVRVSGWWDTLPLLARAKASNERRTEYLEKGLVPWLARWKEERADDAEYRKRSAYTKQMLEEEVLEPLRQQAAFFAHEPTALSIREDARTALAQALEDFLEEMEAFWSAEFSRKLPSYPADISEASSVLKPWSEEGSELLALEAGIREALYDITKLEVQENDPLEPVLKLAEKDLERVFDAFRMFFPKSDSRVQVTFAETAVRLGRLGQVLAPVVGGFREDHAEGRRLASDVLNNRSRAVVFNKVFQSILMLRRDALSPGAPADRLAGWADEVSRVVLRDLMGLAAADINREWKERHARWRRTMSTGSPNGFLKLFAEEGELYEFRAEFLDDFFEPVESGYTGKEVLGHRLELSDGFRQFVAGMNRIKDVLFSEQGNIFEEELEIELAEVDADAFRLAFVGKGGETQRSPVFEHQSEVVRQRLRWGPGTCEAFVLELDFGDGFKEAMRWTGGWAVAEALAAAVREGDTAEWVGVYEGRTFKARVKVTELGPLARLFLEAGGRNPLRSLGALLPESIVR
ncbi:MAG: hypothetical protein ACYS99_17725, partial [Planctomycetota bacterium]